MSQKLTPISKFDYVSIPNERLIYYALEVKRERTFDRVRDLVISVPAAAHQMPASWVSNSPAILSPRCVLDLSGDKKGSDQLVDMNNGA